MTVPFRFPYKNMGFLCLLAGTALTGHAASAADESAVRAKYESFSEHYYKKNLTKQAAPQAEHRDQARQGKGDAAAPKQENILVKARRREQMEVKLGGQAGILGNKKGLDLPFNLRSYTSSMILNQQSQTLGQVLQNDPSVRTTYGYGNFSETFIIRGQQTYSDDVAINGVYGLTPRQLVSPQLYDSVQVLNGANAFVNGAAPGNSATGGSINLQFKHAGNEPLTRLTGDYTSSGQGGGSVDLSRRFGQDKQFGIRFNAAGMDGQTAIKGERRHSVALGLGTDWHNDNTRITADINYQNQHIRQGRGGLVLSGVTSVPRVPSPSYNWSQPWSYEDMNYVFGLLNVEHDFNKHLTLYSSFGGLTGNESGDYDTFTLTDGQTGAGFHGRMPTPYQMTNESTRAGVRAHFNTGPLKHEVNAGGSGLWEDMASAWTYGWGNGSNLYDAAPIARPVTTMGAGNLEHPERNSTTRLYSLFFSDTMSFWHDRIALTGGFRFQNILSKDYKYTNTLDSRYDKSAITPVVGLVVHTTRHSSLYFNRVEGLNKGLQAPTSSQYPNLVNANQFLAPTRTVQYEIGAKYDIGRFSTSLAFYRLTRPQGLITPYGSNAQIFTDGGMQRNQGIELSVNGEIIKGLRFNGGTSLIQTRQMNGAYKGNKAVGIPGYTINGNLEYDVPFAKGLTLTGRVVHTGHQWVNAQNSLRIPNWTTFDVGGRYTFLMTPKQPMTLRFGVENLANTRYWSSSYTSISSLDGYLMQGMPRVFKASFTTDL